MAKVAYNNMHRRISGYNNNKWDSARSMFVNTAIGSFDDLLRKNICGFKNTFLT